MFRRFMRLGLIVVEPLISLRHGDIEHGAFRLFGLQLQRVECGPILPDFREETDKTVLNDHTSVVVEELNILRERARRHIDLDRLCLDGRALTGNEVAFGALDCGTAFLDSLAIGGCLFSRFFRLTFKTHFFQLTVCNRHHGFVESIDRRIVFPVQRAVKFQLLFT